MLVKEILNKDLNLDDLNVSLDEFITLFKTQRENIPEEYRESAEVLFELSESIRPSSCNIEIYYYRSETAEEEKLRTKVEALKKDEVNKKKLETYLQLQKELGLDK